MGLQMDPSTRGKLIVFLKNHGYKLSLLSYFGGVIWMALLVHHEFSAKNYFSENQLLPGMVETRFSEYRYSSRLFDSMQGKCISDHSILQTKVKKELEEMNLDVYQQSFSIPSMMLNGSNVYGYYRAPRASGVESIVINVPLHPNCSSLGAVSLMLGLAKYISKQSYWAKDVVFVLTEHNLYGMKAWLSSYFHEQTPGIISEELYAHGGSIQAAIILDFPSEYVTHFDLLIEGLNGQLPNLDVINLVFQIGRVESVPVKFAHQVMFYQPNTDYLANFQTLIRMMISQASSSPNGNHGLFFRYRIEAVTLKGSIDQQFTRQRIYPEQQGRFIEGILRSVNNMLEHFHQSFFLYVLPNTHRYISIGMYMPPIACLLLPLIIKLLILWSDVFNINTDVTDNLNRDHVPLSILFQASTVRMFGAASITSLGISHIVSGHHLVYLKDAGCTNIFSQHFLVLVTVLLFLWIIRPTDVIKLYVLQLYAVLYLALMIGIVSILNFSLAYFMAIFFIPIVFIKWTVTAQRITSLVKTLFMMVLNPSTVLLVICFLSILDFKQPKYDSKLLNDAIDLYQRIFNNQKTSVFIQNMNVNICLYYIIPLWLVFGSV